MKFPKWLVITIFVFVVLYGYIVLGILAGLVAPSYFAARDSSFGPHPFYGAWWAPIVGIPSLLCMFAAIFITWGLFVGSIFWSINKIRKRGNSG